MKENLKSRLIDIMIEALKTYNMSSLYFVKKGIERRINGIGLDPSFCKIVVKKNLIKISYKDIVVKTKLS